MITFGPEVCANFKTACEREWLETNGLGGYASSTLAGANTRRYHGLLVAAVQPLWAGVCRALEPHTAQNTTPTSYETFVAEEFIPLYEGKSAAA